MSCDIAYATLPNSFAIRTAGMATLTSVAPCSLASGRHGQIAAPRASFRAGSRPQSTMLWVSHLSESPVG
eukprot:3475547-Pleurochrysis_carterae.AAC.1